MTRQAGTSTPERPPDATDQRRGPRLGAVELFIALIVVAVLARGWLVAHTGSARLLTWMTIFVSIVIQATPFVVLGTVISAAIAAFVPPAFFARALPRRGALAVPVAGVARAILPGCESGSVPVASALVPPGRNPAAALRLQLPPPPINPVGQAPTIVGFPAECSLRSGH